MSHRAFKIKHTAPKGPFGPACCPDERQRLHTFHAIVGEALAEFIDNDEADAGRVIGTTQFLEEEATVVLLEEVKHCIIKRFGEPTL